MKFYTPKTLEKETQFLTSEKAIKKARTIWKLASINWKLRCVTLERMDLARKLYNAIKTAQRYRNYYLEWDSNASTESARYWADYWNGKEEKKTEEARKIAKKLNLFVVYGTFPHISEYKDYTKTEII